MKVTVLGAAGGIGQALALLLKTQLPANSELSLYDIAPVTPGVAVDLSHIPTAVEVKGFSGEDAKPALQGADRFRAGYCAGPAARRVPGQPPGVADGLHPLATRGGLAAIAGPADAHARGRLDAFQTAELVRSANGFSQRLRDGR